MRKLNEIAKDVRKDWKNVYFGAVPYLEALERLENLSDVYGMETAVSIVNYFLANATYWRGQKAREIKKELNDMLKEYKSNPDKFPKGKTIQICF